MLWRWWWRRRSWETSKSQTTNIIWCKRKKSKEMCHFKTLKFSCLDISFTVMHKSPWQPKRTSSWHLSAINPSRASRAKSAIWSLSSMKSSSSLVTSKGPAQTLMFSSPSTVSTVTQASAIWSRSSATFSSEAKRTASFWRCWTSESCWGSKWSMTAAAATAGGI